MSQIYIPAALRRLVISRAQGKCEYCLLHQDDSPFTHPIDHIVALKHGGATMLVNLALACINCNRQKGSDLTGIDPISGRIVRTFDPRQQDWHVHFRLEGVKIIGLSETGRATVALLRVNDSMRLLERESLRLVGRYPL